MLIPPIQTSPRLLLRNDARPIVIVDAIVDQRAGMVKFDAAAASGAGHETTFRAIGYRQTKLSAAKGGTHNANYFRFRNEGMRAFGRSFRGKTFISGHDKGDARARGGTIIDAWTEETDLEYMVLYDIAAQAAWAKEGLANGTIDRFSMGAAAVGDIMCTVHEVPLWSTDECYCWRGEVVDGKIVEFEYEDAEGQELSAVNVPAVDGTAIIENTNRFERAVKFATEIAEVAAYEQLLGRSRPKPRAKGGYTAARASITMTEKKHAQGDLMDRALICKQLGLPVTATDEEILAKVHANAAKAAQASTLETQLADVTERERQRSAELDAAHVEAEIARLKSTRVVSDKLIMNLRETAKTSRASFDSTLSVIEESAPAIAPGPGAARAELQSDKKPADVPGAALELDADGPDALEANRSNPHLKSYMKGCGVTAEQVRKHGARQFVVVPQLSELADNTAARGDRMGTGK